MSDTENNSHLEDLHGAGEAEQQTEDKERPEEIGGPAGLEPTRYGDWERKGRCIDF